MSAALFRRPRIEDIHRVRAEAVEGRYGPSAQTQVRRRGRELWSEMTTAAGVFGSVPLLLGIILLITSSAPDPVVWAGLTAGCSLAFGLLAYVMAVVRDGKRWRPYARLAGFARANELGLRFEVCNDRMPAFVNQAMKEWGDPLRHHDVLFGRSEGARFISGRFVVSDDRTGIREQWHVLWSAVEVAPGADVPGDAESEGPMRVAPIEGWKTVHIEDWVVMSVRVREFSWQNVSDPLDALREVLLRQ